MAEFLVIRIGDSVDGLAHWIAVDSSGARRSPPVTGALSEAVADIGERSVIVLVPSADVLTTTAEIPIKGGAKLLAALPFALEEYLADDVDDLHFAAGSRRRSGRMPVSVVNREKLSAWLHRLQDAGIKPSSVIADSYGLARIPATISMLVADDQVFINDGADIELVIQNVGPSDALAAIGALDDISDVSDEDEAMTSVLPRHVLVYCDASDEERFQHDWIAIRQELDSLDVKLLPDGIMPRLAVTVATGAGINLLQGSFAKKAEYSGYFKPWKYAAMLLLALAVTMFTVRGAEYFQLSRQEVALNEQFQNEYRSIFPGAPQQPDPRAAVASAKSRLGTSATAAPVFLQSMQQLSAALQQNTDAKIEAISYRAGVVDIRITAANVSALDSIQQIVAQSGQFAASIQSTNQDDDKVNSRIQIQAN